MNLAEVEKTMAAMTQPTDDEIRSAVEQLKPGTRTEGQGLNVALSTINFIELCAGGGMLGVGVKAGLPVAGPWCTGFGNWGTWTNAWT